MKPQKMLSDKLLIIVFFSVFSITFAGCAVSQKQITLEERAENIQVDLKMMYSGQEPVTGPITLEEAMARAVKYNLEHRLKLMEEALAYQRLKASDWDLLPRLTAEAGYSKRNNEPASSSMSILTNTQSLEPSVSQEKSRATSDLSLTWNILDFGVSYFQARQQGNRHLIAMEKRRKTVQNLMRQVRQAYWEAAGAQVLSDRIDDLLIKAKKSLETSRQVKDERLRPPLEMLRYEESLLGIVNKLKGMRDELRTAKPRLAALMNLSPGKHFDIVVPENLPAPDIKLSLNEMETYALLHRPDLSEAEYEARINVDETKKTIARLFPGVELRWGIHYDSNDYLVNSSWMEGGAKLAWNLLNIFSGPARYKEAKAMEKIGLTRRLVLSMAAITQVHIARMEYDSRLDQLQWVTSYRQVKKEIYEQIVKEKESKTQNNLEEIRAATDYLITRLQEFAIYAQLQGAYGKVQSTLGVDSLPETITSDDIQTLSGAIREKMN